MDQNRAARQLQALTKLLYNQPSPQRAVVEVVSRLRVAGIDLVHGVDPVDAISESVGGGDDSSTESKSDKTGALREPIIAHLPGSGRQAVVIACPAAPLPAGRRLNDHADPLPSAETVAQRLADDGTRAATLVGRDILSVWAPQALMVKLARDLALRVEADDKLPGHVFFMLVPQARGGGLMFEHAGERLAALLDRQHLNPVALLAPGQPRMGAGSKRDANNKLVLTAGNHGVVTIQLTAFGVPAGAEVAVGGFDPIRLLADVLGDVRKSDEFKAAPQAQTRAPLPPPVITGIRSSVPHAAGHLTAWACAELHVPYVEDDPAAKLDTIKEIAYASFAQTIADCGLAYDLHLRASRGQNGGGLGFRPAVVTHAELMKLVVGSLPTVGQPDEHAAATLPWASERACQRTIAAYEASPMAGRPLLVLGIVPPAFPPQSMDAEDPVRAALKRVTRDAGGAVSTAGGCFGAFNRVGLGLALSKPMRALSDEMVLPDDAGPFSLSTAWPPMRLIGFGPAGIDYGMHSERVLIDPSFTRLPGLLRALVPDLMGVKVRAATSGVPGADAAKKAARTGFRRLRERLFGRGKNGNGDNGTEDHREPAHVEAARVDDDED